MDWLVSNGFGWLPWRWALVIAVVIGVLALATRMQPRWRWVSSSAGEIALLMVAYTSWQFATALTRHQTRGVSGRDAATREFVASRQHQDAAPKAT